MARQTCFAGRALPFKGRPFSRTGPRVPSPSPPAPALPPGSRAADPRDEAFLREVDEAYRAEALERFWTRWGRWILAAVGLLVLGVGGFLLWQAEEQRRLEDRAERFSAAIDLFESGDATAAVEALGRIETEGGSYARLATLMQGAVAAEGGDLKRARAAFRAVAADPNVPEPLRDAAAFQALRLEFDDLPPAEVLARLKPYLEGDSPWAPAAVELAGLAHLRAGNPEAAGPLFLRLAADTRAPDTMRARAEQMAAALGQDTRRIVSELERRAGVPEETGRGAGVPEATQAAAGAPQGAPAAGEARP